MLIWSGEQRAGLEGALEGDAGGDPTSDATGLTGEPVAATCCFPVA